jgi:hypothetical protein
VNPDVRRIRLALAGLAMAVLVALFFLKRAGIDDTLFRILAITGGLLVTLLFVTYRALLKMVEAAKANTQPPPPVIHEDDR